MAIVKKKHTPYIYEVQYITEEHQDGLRLDQFLQSILTSFSRSEIQKKIQSGTLQIINRDATIKSSMKVKQGDQFNMRTTPDEMPTPTFGKSKLSQVQDCPIIYEDQNMIIINKPPLMSTHPTGRHLFHCATLYLQEQGKGKLHTVHRLDHETSGVLTFAKNPDSAALLSKLFQQRHVSKLYFFIAHKPKQTPAFPLKATESLGPKQTNPRVLMHSLKQDDPNAKKAETHFYLVEELQDYLLLVAQPRTGRQHQIRAHALCHGFPLVGDKLYRHEGPEIFLRFSDNLETEKDLAKLELPRHALHALSISFPKPIDQIFTADIPEDFQEWLYKNSTMDMQALNSTLQQICKNIF